MTTRTRFREPQTVAMRYDCIKNIHDPAWPPFIQFSGYRTHSISEEMTDTVTPGYYKLRKKGLILPSNPMTHRKVNAIEESMGDWGYTLYRPNDMPDETLEFRGQSATCGLQSAPGFSVDNFPVLDDNYVRGLYTSALAKARTRQMDFLTFYAEWRKTKELVTGALTRTLARALALQKQLKGKKLTTRISPKEFTDAWLEYRYGWRILGYDIEDISKHIERMHNGFLDRWRAKQDGLLTNNVRDQNYVSNSMYFSNGGIGGKLYSNRVKLKERHEIRSRVGVMIESVMREHATIDPLATVWEVVPYSFVVDWFVNVNDYLIAISPFADIDIVSSYNRVEYVKTLTVESGPAFDRFDYTNGFYAIAKQGGSKLHMTESFVSRGPLKVDEQRVVLQMQNNFDGLKAIDSFALIFARLRRLRAFAHL